MVTVEGDGGSVRIRARLPSDDLGEGLHRPGPDQDGGRHRRSLVAVDGQRIVGVGTLEQAEALGCAFAEISVLPEDRRQGIGTHLFEAVRQTAADPALPVVGRVMASEPLRRAFAVHLGGEILLHCPMPAIDLLSSATRAWVATQSVPNGYAVLSAAAVDEDTLREAWAACFVWTHQPFGRVRVEALPPVWASYRAGVDNALSQVCRDPDGSIVAISLVSPEVWDGRTFIVGETTRRDQPAGTRLLGAAVAASLTALAERGIEVVELEGHSTDSHIPELIDAIPSERSDALDIYRLPSR